MGQGVQMWPDRARDIIMACAVLHNISKDMRQPEVGFNVQEDKECQQPLQNAPNGAAVQELIIQNYFALISNINNWRKKVKYQYVHKQN